MCNIPKKIWTQYCLRAIWLLTKYSHNPQTVQLTVMTYTFKMEAYILVRARVLGIFLKLFMVQENFVCTHICSLW